MSKPCNGNHPGREPRPGGWTPDQCRICWLYEYDVNYRRMWDAPAAPAVEPPLPGLLVQAKNLAVDAARVAASGFAQVSAEEQARRQAICESCPSGKFRASDQRCAVCGCAMAVKTPWTALKCPLAHW